MANPRPPLVLFTSPVQSTEEVLSGLTKNQMTEKEALLNALEYAESSFVNDGVKKKAARAFFICEWLEDKNWHPEMQVLIKRVNQNKYLSAAFKELENDDRETSRLDHAVSLLNHIFGWGLAPAEWQATQGAHLVDELWNIINLQN